MAESESWSRTHSNGWTGWVYLEPGLEDRYAASAAHENDTRSFSHHVTAELAKAAADASVRRASDHECTAACTPWHRDV